MAMTMGYVLLCDGCGIRIVQSLTSAREARSVARQLGNGVPFAPRLLGALLNGRPKDYCVACLDGRYGDRAGV